MIFRRHVATWQIKVQKFKSQINHSSCHLIPRKIHFYKKNHQVSCDKTSLIVRILLIKYPSVYLQMVQPRDTSQNNLLICQNFFKNVLSNALTDAQLSFQNFSKIWSKNYRCPLFFKQIMGRNIGTLEHLSLDSHEIFCHLLLCQLHGQLLDFNLLRFDRLLRAFNIFIINY